MNRAEFNRAKEQFEQVRTIGELTITMPKIPAFAMIDNHDLPVKEQKFNHSPVLKYGQEPEDEFIMQEYERMMNGYWFFSNGRLEYITGAHYFLLNYWTDKGKRLSFVDAQRDVFLWWNEIEKNTNLSGGNLITNRRFGKTVVATCIGYYRTTTKSDRRCGIQSKTNKDGDGVFKKLIASWMRLPDWLKPLDTGETRPATILEFFPPRKRSANQGKKVYDQALYSSIDFRPSVEEAYDGDELHTYIEDECGKTKEINTDNRYNIVKYCLMKGPTIIGKALRTTTVEDMEKKGGANMKKTWDASRMATKNPDTGRTATMLTNLFIPSDYGYLGNHPQTGHPFVDEYGYSDRQATREFILSTWKNLEGDDLAAEQQKNPLTEKHIWQLKNFGGAFDNELLEIQKDYLERTNDNPEDNAPQNLVRRVTFYRDAEGIVKWRDDKNGHCEMVWDFPDPKYSNKNKIGSNGLKSPDNDSDFAVGVDPAAATITTGKEKSKAVAYVFRKGDMNDPENSGMAVLRFAPWPRMRFKKDFHKYVMMICEYYGCKANYESNIDDYYEAFIEEGFKNYVMWRPKCTIDPQRKNVKVKYGTPSNDAFALQKQTDIADEYIKTRYHKIYFLQAVESFIKYDPDDRTKSDDAIAFMMALIAGMDKKMDVKPNTSKLSILRVFKRTA